jgi:hypothetical protein
MDRGAGGRVRPSNGTRLPRVAPYRGDRAPDPPQLGAFATLRVQRTNLPLTCLLGLSWMAITKLASAGHNQAPAAVPADSEAHQHGGRT